MKDYEKMFDELTKQNPSYWVWDGIHPTAAGHQKMADLWLSTVINSEYPARPDVAVKTFPKGA